VKQKNNNEHILQIGKHLKRLRLQSKLTQSKIGSQVKPPVRFQQVQKWEKGKNKIFAHQLLKLCEVNNWNLNEFKASESSVSALDS
jgi:transcriptional regulator with XRE-family HTH domain